MSQLESPRARTSRFHFLVINITYDGLGPGEETDCYCCSVAHSCPNSLQPRELQQASFRVLHYFPGFAQLMSIELMMPSNHLMLCHPLLLLPTIFPSIRVFSNESALRIRWPKYWSFSFSITPSREYSELISFRIDWFGLLAVQGTFKSLL